MSLKKCLQVMKEYPNYKILFIVKSVNENLLKELHEHKTIRDYAIYTKKSREYKKFTIVARSNKNEICSEIFDVVIRE